MGADEPAGGTNEAGPIDGADHIELSIPARAEFLSLARLAAGVVGARADLGLDDVEDLRLGVEELCLVVVGPNGSAPGRLALRYAWDDDRIEIACSVVTDDGADPTVDPSPRGDTGDHGVQRELSTQILDALVDEHGASHDSGVRRAWLTMRRDRSSAH